MKRELLRGLTMLTLIVVLALATAVASNAQTSDKVVADIPFAFSVGHKAMPAGQYAVRTVTGSNGTLMIQSADGKTSAVRLSNETDRNKSNTNARLVFHRYGERYFLSQVWNGYDESGRELLKSQEESAIERELGSIAKSDTTKGAYETIVVVASLR